MVNNPYMRMDPGTQPDPMTTTNRFINGGPVFDLGLIQGDLAKLSVNAVTAKSRELVRRRAWAGTELRSLIALLRVQDFENSQWCTVSGGLVVPADGYGFRMSANALPNQPDDDFYVKLSVNRPGHIVMLVSVHGDKDK